MTTANQTAIAKYKNSFLKEVEANVEEGHWVRMCMQCGVCAGSCPLGNAWAHPPQELFMMIRAGKREEVLSSDSMWMCTSCYNCIVRCPRKLPITHIMHGLAQLCASPWASADRASRRARPPRCLDNLIKKGLIVNELTFSLALYFKDGFVQGIKNALNMQAVGLGLVKAKRLNPMEILGGHGVKDQAGFKAMIEKARQIEDRKKGFAK